MASTAHPFRVETRQRAPCSPDLRFGLTLTSVLTLFAVLVHGYHPYTEDGGVYLTGARRLLDPSLYPRDTAFVTAPTRFSIFAPFVAGLTRLSGLGGSSGLALVVLLLHVATVWATLASSWLLACRCFPERRARSGGVLLLACWLGLPVAGTSLLLMDPYLTARSFATPCLLLALAGVLQSTSAREPNQEKQAANGRRRGLALWAGSIVVATLMHPLMAAYAVGASVLLAWIRVSRAATRALGLAGIGLAALAAAWIVHAFAPAEPPGYTQVALSRSYWFLARWRWYELAGIAGPVAVLTAFAVRDRSHPPDEGSATRALALAGICAAFLATAVSAIFVHQRGPDYLVARLQPMRELEFVYVALIMLLGGWLGRAVLGGRPWRWVAAALLLSVPLYVAARRTTSHSRAIELPWEPPVNAWSQAFVWIRDHAPGDALFALYPDYVKTTGEDAQSFRAIAERSVLADYSKDGGEASIAPQLTKAWVRAQAAQQGLATESDAARRSKLVPLGVSWIVIEAGRPTGLDCPYRNSAVKVCRLQ